MNESKLIPTLRDEEKIRLELGRQQYGSTEPEPELFILNENQLRNYIQKNEPDKDAYLILRASDVKGLFYKAERLGELEAFKRGLNLSMRFIAEYLSDNLALLKVWEKTNELIKPREVDLFLQLNCREFYYKIPEMLKDSDILQKTSKGYDWQLSKAVLASLLKSLGFSDWEGIQSYITVKGKPLKNLRQTANNQNQAPGDWAKVKAIFLQDHPNLDDVFNIS